jgi:ABC-type nitrate/sulfonate/bicarbonate transport system permease component
MQMTEVKSTHPSITEAAQRRPPDSPALASGRNPVRRKPVADWLISAASIVLIFLAWTILSTSGWLPPGYLPSPWELMTEFEVLLTQGYKRVSLWQHIGISLFRTLSGFLLGTMLGIPLGLYECFKCLATLFSKSFALSTTLLLFTGIQLRLPFTLSR